MPSTATATATVIDRLASLTAEDRATLVAAERQRDRRTVPDHLVPFLRPGAEYTRRFDTLVATTFAAITGPDGGLSPASSTTLETLAGKTVTILDIARLVLAQEGATGEIVWFAVLATDLLGSAYGRRLSGSLLTAAETAEYTRTLRRLHRLQHRALEMTRIGLSIMKSRTAFDTFLAACDAADRVLDRLGMVTIDRVEAIIEKVRGEVAGASAASRT